MNLHRCSDGFHLCPFRCHALDPCLLRIGNGEPDREGAAYARLAFYVDTAPVQLNDLFHDGQTEAGSGYVHLLRSSPAEEPVEDVGKFILWYP